MDDIKLYTEPELKKPYLIAAGPGTANVSLVATTYLRDKLGAEPFAEIESTEPFSMSYDVSLEEGVINLIPTSLEERVENKFYYWKGDGEHDLIFFTGNAHPLPGKGLEFAGSVVDFASEFDVQGLYILGAYATDVTHRADPQVTGMVSRRDLMDVLTTNGLGLAPSITFAHNLITWILIAAIERDIDAVGLIGELPRYATVKPSMKVCKRLIETLAGILGIRDVLDLSDLDSFIEEEDSKMDAWIEELRNLPNKEAKEFLNYFEALEKEENLITEEDKHRLIQDLEDFFKQRGG
ncbi:MAG: PAC2 family protein [Dehalococcoidia bacterium]